MNDLELYGWNQELLQQKEASSYKEQVHGRVIVTHKTRYVLVAEAGNFDCELSGNMLFGRDRYDYPCTGDWVLFQPIDDNKGIILDMLPRKKTLHRSRSDTTFGKQALASHVDKAFVVQSLDQGFSVRRIERFLLQLAVGKIQPVLIFTKADLNHDKASIEQAISHLGHKIPVVYTSIFEGGSIEQLRRFIQTGETVVFLGLSGVGKSTLVNFLCNREIQQTAAISSATGKGKHTTSKRELILLEQGGILIDTPGIKLFGISTDDHEALLEVLDIDHLKNECRYTNCTHTNEKGCAVIKALEDGVLDRGIYNNYQKLKREAWHYTVSEHEKRKQGKQFARMVKHIKRDHHKGRQ
ncbi:ribosome small subunit-dependent GTPase A [Roseimarinus sediminis]|uniref:ribosome small subunit-dependent GTPase A n=1 Tax=Roseimarinus sediminis TaxID=1610899 RepID=UPI003D1D6590